MGQVKENSSAGHSIIKSSTISKEDLVLLPNGNSDVPKTTPIPRNISFNSLHSDFILADCLDLVHAGMEAIIEDEVTHRFVAEELKVRVLIYASIFISTNVYPFLLVLKSFNAHKQSLRIISVRLTITWIIGFFICYFILLPYRITICFLSVSLLEFIF